jgi:tetratricopeptide (TPR) repeat protein
MPAAPHPLVLRAREALQRGDMRAVETAAEERLKTAGRDVNALELRFIVQQRRGQFGQAARTLDTVIGIDRHADWAYNELVQLFMTHGKRDEAEKVARAALLANPRNAQAHYLFGSILSDMSQLPPGEWHLRASLELSGPQAPALTSLGANLMKQGRVDEAKACVAKARELAPEDAQTAPKLSEAEEDLARGRAHDRNGSYSAAWDDFIVGKTKLLKEAPGTEYRADAVESLFTRCKQFFTRETLSLLARSKPRPDTAQPVFVMGFPRSGASAVEKILGRHPALSTGGQLPFVADMSKLAGNLYPGPERFPENLGHSWIADYQYTATLFRDYYLARAEQYGLLKSGKRYFTDAMPFNEVYLPLIRMAFPKVKIVRVVRHPLDVCISMLSNRMADGFHAGYRVEDIAHNLTALFDLVEHYRRVLELDDYVLRYESLVADQAGETRKLLAYLDLPFEESCLAEKLNAGAVDRHRHYEMQLRPYVARLQPLMSAYGYKP